MSENTLILYVLIAERGQSLAMCGHGQVAILYHVLHLWGVWCWEEDNATALLEVSDFVSLSPSGRLWGPALWMLSSAATAHPLPMQEASAGNRAAEASPIPVEPKAATPKEAKQNWVEGVELSKVEAPVLEAAAQN